MANNNKSDQKQMPPSGAAGGKLSDEFANIAVDKDIGYAVPVGGVSGIFALGVALLPEDAPLLPAFGIAALAAAIGGVAGGVVAEKDMEKDPNKQEMALVAKMDSYAPQIQAHYMTFYPDTSPPQHLAQFVDALRDKKVFDAVRSAATKDADPSVIAALDQFSKVEQGRPDRALPKPVEHVAAPEAPAAAIPKPVSAPSNSGPKR